MILCVDASYLFCWSNRLFDLLEMSIFDTGWIKSWANELQIKLTWIFFWYQIKSITEDFPLNTMINV